MDVNHSDSGWADASHASPPLDPAGIRRERRLHVRAYTYWASLLGNRRLPRVAELCRSQLRDVGERTVLLDFTRGDAEPRIAYLGDELARTCRGDPLAIEVLSDAPEGSLLRRLAAHYAPVLATRAPSGFESSVTDPQGETVLYRGIMLPFSPDDNGIDYVLAVLNWKEVSADANTPGGSAPHPQARATSRVAPVLADWADGPGSADAPCSDAPGANPRRPDTAPAPDGADDVLTNSPAGDTTEAQVPGVGHDLAHRPLQSLASLAVDGPEYALLLVRRSGAGSAMLIGELPHDPEMLAQAARRLSC